LMAGDWTPRSLPTLAIAGEGTANDWAVNDFVVARRGAAQLAAVVSVDEEPYVRLAGDGVIVATPQGSSAYSMAAGGPVLATGTPAFVCTPLAMHGGCAPPIVVPADAALTVDVQPGYGGFEVEIDGRRSTPEAHRFRITLRPGGPTLVSFASAPGGLAGLRRRGLIADSPRVRARDDRAAIASQRSLQGRDRG
jgi:NAD+ kinase